MFSEAQEQFSGAGIEPTNAPAGAGGGGGLARGGGDRFLFGLI